MKALAYAPTRGGNFIAVLKQTVLLCIKQPIGHVQFEATPSVRVDADVSFANVAPIGAWAVWPQVERSSYRGST